MPRSTTARSFILPTLVLLGGWALSAWVFVLLRDDAARRQEEFFTERVAEAQAAIRVRMTAYEDALRGGASYFTATKSVDRDGWRIFAESLQLKNRYPGINGLGVILAVRPDQIEEWKTHVRHPGEPDPVVMPFPNTKAIPGATQHYLITFIEGNVADRPPIGRDIATDPSRREAADLARDSGELRLNHRIAGSRDTQRRAGLLIYMPVYAKGAPTATVEERRAAHVGWIFAQTYPDVFLQGVLGPMGETLRLHFFEAGGLNAERLLYASTGEASGPLPAFARVTEMEMAGRKFQLGWQRGPKFPARENGAAIGAGLGGVGATLLLVGLVLSLQSVGARANAIAAERTAGLVASEERFRGAFDHAGIGMALVDLDGRWLRANRVLCEIVGYPEAELQQKTVHDIVAPEDAGLDRAERQALLAGVQRAYQVEQRWRHRDGRLVWIRRTVTLGRDAKTDARHFVCQIEDITASKAHAEALRQSQQMFQRLFESSPDAVILVGRDSRIVRPNARAEALFGWRAGQLTGRRFDELLPARVRAEHGGHLTNYFSNPHARPVAGGLELFGRHHDETEFPIDILLSPVESTDGGQTLAVVRDITERKRLEENLANARDAALESLRMKSEFLANISHEIRTPMNAVVGMSGLLAETKLEPHQDEMVRAIQAGGESLLTIINDVLDFSKIEAGKLRLETSGFDLRQVIEETVALLAPRAQEKSLRFSAEIDPALPSNLLGDPGRIRQVFTNLLGNALKFTEHGAVTVTVKVVNATPERITVRIGVRDTGVGIAPHAQRHLFQPFTQVDNSATRRFGGTGLGLAISRQLVELMGGAIGFESESGRGSFFWFEVGMVRLAPVPPAADRIPAGRRVLVVDDNEHNRRITLGQLARMGVTAEAVADGETALARLRDPAAGPWHAVLLDWQMNGMSGIELATEIRVTPATSGLPLVMLSSAGVGYDPALVAASGIAGFLTKPTSDAQLQRCLARILGAAADAPAAAPAAIVHGPRRRILLVEDNPANQRVATLLLAKLGHEVEVASNGQEGLDRLARGPRYDVVLMDCQMPVLDGYEATRRIRRGEVRGVDRQIPIIALTAYALASDREKCFEAGMIDHLSKPIRAAELSAALERLGPGAVPPPPVANGALDHETVAMVRSLPGARGRSLLPEMISIYLANEPAQLQRLGHLAVARDDALGDAAHQLAGSAGAFGGAAMRSQLLELELISRRADWPKVDAQLVRVRQESARLREAIAKDNLLAE